MTATAAPPATDRRVAPRHQPAFGTVCRLGPGRGRPLVGLVWNISATGVSMLLADPPRPGAEVDGELAPEGGGPGLSVTLRVVHVRRAATGDYVLGARFGRELGADEVRQFLTPPPEDLRELPKQG
jgi:hypothetical protein